MTKIGDEILEGLLEALAHAGGEEVAGMVVHQVNVKPDDPHRGRSRISLGKPDSENPLLRSTS